MLDVAFLGLKNLHILLMLVFLPQTNHPVNPLPGPLQGAISSVAGSQCAVVCPATFLTLS